MKHVYYWCALVFCALLVGGCASGDGSVSNSQTQPSATNDSLAVVRVQDISAQDTSSVKNPHAWHPGHYVFCSMHDIENDLSGVNAMLSLKIDGAPVFAGVQIGCPWNQLDIGTTKANYDFSQLLTDINRLNLTAAQNVWIQVQTKTFSKTAPPPTYIPAWLGTDNYYSYQLLDKSSNTTNYGIEPSIWVPTCNTALKNLYTALGSQLLKATTYNPEGVVMSETALSSAYPWPGGQKDSKDSNGEFYYQEYINNLVDEAKTLKAALTPSTLTSGGMLTALQYVNNDYQYDNTTVTPAVHLNLLDTSATAGLLQQWGIAQGGPDVTTDTSYVQLLDQVYPTYDYAAGHIALGAAVQHDDYTNSNNQWLSQAQNLHLNYMFWQYETGQWTGSGAALTTFQNKNINVNNTLLVTTRPANW